MRACTQTQTLDSPLLAAHWEQPPHQFILVTPSLNNTVLIHMGLQMNV